MPTSSSLHETAGLYEVGQHVSYGLHGKCVITGIETKSLDGASVRFYQVQAVKNPISERISLTAESRRRLPYILIPIESASSKGLRPLMSQEQASLALRTIAEPDFHYPLDEAWVSKQKRLEEALRREGFLGLAKVVGHLYVLSKRDVVPASALQRFFTNAYKILLRELSDSLQIPTKEAEQALQKALRQKLAYDN